LANVHQLLIVGEAHAGLLNLSADLDESRVGAVDHDIRNIIACQQRL
jgi:hypothetical protein